MVNIGGTALPTEGLVNVLQDIGTSIAKRETIPEAIIRAAPDAMPLLLQAGGTVIPYAGAAAIGVSIMIKYSKPQANWTPEERQRWWDQAQGVH